VPVTSLTLRVAVTSSSPAAEAIVLTNNGTAATDFDLTHNGHLAFSSMEQVLDAVRQLPDEVAAEPFERKLWRFVRDNTYHFPPVSGERWMDGAWPTLNSFGFGFCSNVASVYVQIARAAGYEARVWALEGHIVPEIRLNGAWQMYDPDLGVYYHKADGTLAGVEDLVADPSLITSPIDPIFAPGANAYAYGQVVAGIYGSTADNLIAPGYPAPEPFQGSRITLPAGARLVYPGVWTVAPTGYDGPTPYTVQEFRQSRLELPAGFTGSIAVPWVLWDVQGSGTVRVLGQDFATGSAALRTFLVRPGQPVTAIEAVDNPSGLALVMMINPLWYDTNSQNDLEFTGKDVWALDAGTYPLAPANRSPPPVPASLRRPRA